MRRFVWAAVCAAILAGGAGLAARKIYTLHMGKQPDGSFVVATGQRIEPGSIAFDGRPIDLALHPSGQFIAVVNSRNVFLADRSGVIDDSRVDLPSGAAHRGAVWSPDGTRLFVSIAAGNVREFALKGRKLSLKRVIGLTPQGEKGDARPAGLAISHDGKRLYVACCDRNSVEEIDADAGTILREFKVENMPFDVQITADDGTLVVSNWGGRPVTDADEKGESGNAVIVVDPRGAPASGTVSIVRRDSGKVLSTPVGLHPTGIAIDGSRAYVANAASDSVSVVDIEHARTIRTIPIRWGSMGLFGSMPNAIAVRGSSIYVCNGGDNALCEVDRLTGKVRGFRPAGFFPTAVAVTPDGGAAFVVNTKGNGSVRRTSQGLVGNAHDFQGTVSVVDLGANLKAATARVAEDAGWNRSRADLHPGLAVYRGAIKHVLYIIKENRTYDEVFGDLPQGNGRASLCSLGARVTPNAHALAQQFALFDNAYASGTNSAEGHQWCNEALANDYIERMYAGYRTYPFDGDCAMTVSSGGFIWDQALKRHRTLRVWGEWCPEGRNHYAPEPKGWKEVWDDRAQGTHRFAPHADTALPSLRPYMNRQVFCWPLTQCDQQRADIFIDEYKRFSAKDAVPNLMIMSLPCDHTCGMDSGYPRPLSMVADNDLALGRIVEAVSHSPQWRDTCIFVVEDDAQAGPDHVDGHRTVCMALSPYVKRKLVDSEFVTQISIVRSIELMLGLDAMCRFDATAIPFTNCFTDTPDPTPYSVVPNIVRLDEMNPRMGSLHGKELYWARQSQKLDWSGLDRPDPQILNQVIWHSIHGVDSPYPAASRPADGDGQ
jgi:YVTN family beta-propeller protein